MQKSITFKNANISFSDVGKGTAVVLIHGFLENSTMWDKIVPALVKRNRVITVDVLGHGKTDCLGYVHTMALFAEAIIFVLKHLKLRKYFLVGHSLGGYISLALAQKNTKQIKGLCLLNSTSNADDEERKKIRFRANKMIQDNFSNLVRMSFVNLFGEKSREHYKNEINLALNEALQTPIQGYIAANEGMRIRVNRNDVLANNNFKKLFIIGKNDPVLNSESLIEEAKETNSEFVVLNGGHMSHIENREELIFTLKGFLKSYKRQ
ncbi:alpha/beta hydrolase [uncultured Polaribacter sp.]|uniref:alpha/beta fold hydrolase n=1 Tax=uncultured Polaribacter sp. TaxID=174711 RepID=UPI002630FD33|nr:alpha/beta hydrolase [uncultured Polaribacter sp.]